MFLLELCPLENLKKKRNNSTVACESILKAGATGYLRENQVSKKRFI